MGYTHYFTQPADFTDSQWSSVKSDIKAILGNSSFISHDLHMDNEVISLNGTEGDGHETFVIYRNQRPSNGYSPAGWDFCKTAKKPYDDIVTAILIRLVLSYNYTVSSDGDWSDWTRGAHLYTATFGARPTNVLTRDVISLA